MGNASPRDIPEDGMSYGENVDSRVRGRVQGIKGNETANASYDARVMSPLLGDENILIGQDDSGQFKEYDIDGDSVTDIGSVTSDYANMLISNNKEVYAPMRSSFRSGDPQDPKWIGEVDKQFDIGSNNELIVDDMGVKSYSEEQDFSDSSASPLITLGHIPGGVDDDDPVLFRDSGSVFEDSNTYFWAVSLIYDGYQESPLIKGYDGGDRWGKTPSGDTAVADLCLRVGFDSEDLSRRITGMNIYRAESPDGGGRPTSDYHLVKTINLGLDGDKRYRDINCSVDADKNSGGTIIGVGGQTEKFINATDGDNVSIDGETYRVTDVDTGSHEITISPGLENDVTAGTSIKFAYDSWFKTDGSDGFPPSYSANNAYYIMLRDEGEEGASYEDNTGISDTLETTHLRYKIGTTYGGYLFVSGCNKDGIQDAEKYIFRSKPRTYSIIDWSQDFTILPEEPTALIGFNGRLYAFGTATMYRINPITIDVEDDYAGVGALNENMVVATNYGMFHADDNNIYYNDGTVSKPIGDPILTLQDESGLGWQEINKTDSSGEHYASMAFDPANKRLLLFVESSGSDTICWAYDVMRERWDLYTDFDMPSDTAVGPNGTMYATTGNTTDGFELKTLFTDSTRKNWKIRTKDFDLGSDSGDFYGYDLQGYGEGDFTIKYAKDGGSMNDEGTTTTDGLRKTTVASADKKMKSIQLQVESASVSDTLDNLTVQFRPQVIQE